MQDQRDHKMFNVKDKNFESLALEYFHKQYRKSLVYKGWVDALGTDIAKVDGVGKIPFLPISFFKSQEVKTGEFEAMTLFESSGTTGSLNSHHWIKDIAIYEEGFLKGFELFYGPVADWCIIGLLPSYLERNNSSLVYMVNRLIKESGHDQSGFYLHEFKNLAGVLTELENRAQKTLLIGVTFALLDFAEQFPVSLKHTLVMETGGMKGRREEMIRAEVHSILKKAFKVPHIHSEYGMTELLSQAYSKGDGIFQCPPWMRIFIRDEEDPLSGKEWPTQMKPSFLTGAINVIDLANIDSCCFIATDDAGRLHPDGSFEVLGRIDNSDLRGCSLMVV